MKLFFNNKYLYTIVSLVIFLSGCKKALDINQDPNNPSLEQGTPKLVFPAAAMHTAGRVGGDLAILGGIWGEYVTQSVIANQYKSIDAYDLKYTDLNDPYTGLYSGGLKNYQFVINKAREAEDWNYNLLGTVMKAYTTQVLVDLYDNIPYFEALQGEGNLNPVFDDGYTIYEDLIGSLDSALSKDFTLSSNSTIGTEDLIFGGDMDQWKRFANTLELKLYLRMINAKPEEAESGVKKLYDRGAEFLTTDAGIFGFTDVPGKDNPLYEQNIRELNVASNLRASTTFVSFLSANGDPRVVYYFGDPAPASINQGDYSNTTDPSYTDAAVFVQAPTDPVIFISAAESYFLQAEARERYYGGDQSKSLYDKGVNASFTAEGLDGSAFVAPGGEYEYPSSGTLEEKIEAIIVQKWVSLPYGVHFLEGFFERNRTGYPKSSPVYSTDPSYVSGQFVISKNSVLPPGKYPKRLVYPDVERTRNNNTPDEVPITTPVWWAK
jgi:hypothetical protein